MKFNGYVNRSTLLHRVDPRVKISWFLGMTILTVISRNPYVLGMLLAGSLLLWTLSGLVKEAGGMARRLLPLLAMAFVTWLLIGMAKNGGEAALLTVGSWELEPADLWKAAVSACRIFLMVSSFYTLIMATNFSEMIYGLQKFRVPFKAAFMVGLVFQIIPMMISEFQTIADAQRARGLELDKGGIAVRIRRYSAVLFPLFIRTIQSGQAIALSMHLYGLQFARRRSAYQKFRISGKDIRFAAFYVVLWSIAVYCGMELPY
ncbi:energy-coupling factor transporter transmembrane component T family protein [Cohnella caldifontis]|uniref:energy-coupling factor transporter transmembrane component T family protein n=1 Tax=Cohnella caldifontis TaxID=3027471 RepID=UPI0023EC22DD|nr:energy-coupling factor transporter transmembrane component T [Cohnella sp. YIM B05605]